MRKPTAAAIAALLCLISMLAHGELDDPWYLPERYVGRIGVQVEMRPVPDFLSASNGLVMFIHAGITKKPVEPLVVTALSVEDALLRQTLTGIEQTTAVVAFVPDHRMTALLAGLARHAEEYQDRLRSHAFGTFIAIGLDNRYGWARFLDARQVSQVLGPICPPGERDDAGCAKIGAFSDFMGTQP